MCGDASDFHPSVQIRSLHNLIGRYLNTALPSEIRSLSGGNMQIIAFLYSQGDNEVFQYDIERRFSVTRSTASRVLGLMEKKGLIERQSVERDARLRRIVLTPVAEDIAKRMYDNTVAVEEDLLKGFNEEERRCLRWYLLRMKQNLFDTGLVSETSRQGDQCENQDKLAQIEREATEEPLFLDDDEICRRTTGNEK